MHTKNSDGTLSVRELLDQAARYADYRKTINKISPLVIAISDHDTLEGSKEAIKIIAQNPEKYKNISFVPAIEFNAQHNSTQLEALAYCINPFNDGLSRFVSSGREANKQYLKSFLESQVNVWEAKAGIPPEKRTTLETIINQAERRNTICSKNIKFFGSPGLIMGFTEALKSIFYERGWKFDGIEKFAHEHGEKYKSFAINPSTPIVEEIVQTVEESGSGFVGIAHPCRNLGGFDLRYLFQDFKRHGIDAVEANYQYPDEFRFPKTFQEHAGLAASINNMVKTGGSDNHTNNIFTNKFNIASLPSQVQAILNSSFRTATPERCSLGDLVLVS
jgi:predicted metal-dependent phosphoesterase TrpH